jgi:hypothetical protein
MYYVSMRTGAYACRVPFVGLIILVVIAGVAICILWLAAYEKKECKRDTEEHEIIEKIKECPMCHVLLPDCVCHK